MKRILIIDDEPAVRTMLSEMIDLLGYQVVVAENGQKGLEEFQKQKFDLIICDVIMPHYDGMWFLQHAKKINKTTPIVMLSGFPSKDYQPQSFIDEGANEFIYKPILFNDLKKLISHYIK